MSGLIKSGCNEVAVTSMPSLSYSYLVAGTKKLISHATLSVAASTSAYLDPSFPTIDEQNKLVTEKDKSEMLMK